MDVALSPSCPLKSQHSYFHTHTRVHTHTCEIFYLVNATHTLFIILLLNGIVKLADIQKLHVDVWMKHTHTHIYIIYFLFFYFLLFIEDKNG